MRLSKKRASEYAKYNREARKFKEAQPLCHARLPGCTYDTTDVHHMAGKIGAALLEVKDWLPVCRSCHQWIELNPKEAKEKGFSKSRLNKTS